ncbi:MAG: ABC transporter permease [Planctomycetes bacterium]|nr:ABC transporter permease [Planctomycetota bacterium]
MGGLKRVVPLRELTSVGFVVAIFLMVGMVNPSFLSAQNIMLCLNGSVVFIMLSVGIAFVIISGEIDVSVGATLGLAATVSATMIRDDMPWTVAVIAAVLIGLAVGLVNGVGVVTFKVPSIIMTLGTNGIVRGLCYVYSGGKWVENLPFGYKALSQATLSGRPGSISWFFFATAIVTMFVYICQYICQNHTNRGRHFYAVGGNEGGATLIGIPVGKTRIIAFVLCGVCASLAGLMYVSRIGFVTPVAGMGYEMKAIAACVLGGVSLSGGIGSVIGAAMGAIIMASIGRILVFMQFSSNYDNTITGVLLITIVVADALLQRRAAEKARRTLLTSKTAASPGEGSP